MARDTQTVLQSSSSSDEEEVYEEKNEIKVLTKEKLYSIYIDESDCRNYDYTYEDENFSRSDKLIIMKLHKYKIEENIFEYKDIDKKIKCIYLELDYAKIDDYDFSFLQYLPNLILIDLYFTVFSNIDVKYENRVVFNKILNIMEYIKNVNIIQIVQDLMQKKDEKFILTREYMKNLSNIKSLRLYGDNKIYLNEDSLLDMSNLKVLYGNFIFDKLSHSAFVLCKDLKYLKLICSSVEDDFVRNMVSYTSLLKLS